jgi:hypothetical protein
MKVFRKYRCHPVLRILMTIQAGPKTYESYGSGSEILVFSMADTLSVLSSLWAQRLEKRSHKNSAPNSVVNPNPEPDGTETVSMLSSGSGFEQLRIRKEFEVKLLWKTNKLTNSQQNAQLKNINLLVKKNIFPKKFIQEYRWVDHAVAESAFSLFILSISLLLDPDRIQKPMRILWEGKDQVPVWWSRPESPDWPAARGSAGPPLVHAP